MVERWRWDQGRLTYFRFENLRKLSKGLVELEGSEVHSEGNDIFRAVLTSETGLPFAPASYTVWRNYARVFQCTLLATQIEGRLVVTDICRQLAATEDSAIGVDEYLSFWIPRFYLPFPAFQEYTCEASRIFPLCAVLKYLLAKFTINAEASINLLDVFSIIAGNQCDGFEPLDHYISLRPTNRVPIGDEERQVREMLIFASQISWLKWNSGTLHLDILPGDLQNIEDLKRVLEPFQSSRRSIPQEEILHLGRVTSKMMMSVALTTREIPEDVLFTEGSRDRVTHLRTERSPQLRRLFFSRNPDPICDMCTFNMRIRYPWTDNLLEIHHLLPLSSAITVTSEGTSLEDIVGLCPNCHRSVHIFYRRWFENNSARNFSSKAPAREVYQAAKEAIQI